MSINKIDTTLLMNNFNNLYEEYKQTNSELTLGMLLGIHRSYACLFREDENYTYIQDIIDNEILKK